MIGWIENELKNDERFFRTHRSCIVNLNNISNVELKNSKIIFGKKSTNLLARDKKNELKDKLCIKN